MKQPQETAVSKGAVTSTSQCTGPKFVTSRCSRDGRVQVIVPIYRSSQMGVMTVRSEAELAALKRQAK
jgi:hypothetical protein